MKSESLNSVNHGQDGGCGQEAAPAQEDQAQEEAQEARGVEGHRIKVSSGSGGTSYQSKFGEWRDIVSK